MTRSGTGGNLTRQVLGASYPSSSSSAPSMPSAVPTAFFRVNAPGPSLARCGLRVWVLFWAVFLGTRMQGQPASAPLRTRAESLRAMESVMGRLPSGPRGVPKVVVLSEVRRDGWVLRDLTYESQPGAAVPAYLMFPESALTNGARHPAMLGLHQTHAAGRKVVVGLGNSPDDAYGAELVKRGFVVLAPAYPLLADHQPDVRGLGFESGTMKAIWDNVRGLDLLSSLPFVSTNRGFGAIGHSLGGHNGLYTAAFDERIRVVVTSCGFDSFRDYYDGNPAVWAEERGWCQLRYMPGLLAYRGRLEALPFDFDDVLGAIAPRRVFVNAPKGDSNFRWRSVDRVVERVRPLWTEEGGPAPEVVHPEGAHRFAPEQRERAYAMLEAVLK